ncbi:MAG: flagellar export chaperone FliS [Thiovulaceae bacterium]|nr:flagellar export chaperone FliS [Sulfurimonadaceae bacterium]
MYQNNAYNTYTQNNFEIESPQKLIEMLYEGILRFNAQAKRAIRDEDIEKRTYWINRSNAVFIELLYILDVNNGGEVAKYLHGLYSHQLTLLVRANMQNKESYLDEVNNVVKGLLEGWRDVTHVAE